MPYFVKKEIWQRFGTQFLQMYTLWHWIEHWGCSGSCVLNWWFLQQDRRRRIRVGVGFFHRTCKDYWFKSKVWQLFFFLTNSKYVTTIISGYVWSFVDLLIKIMAWEWSFLYYARRGKHASRTGYELCLLNGICISRIGLQWVFPLFQVTNTWLFLKRIFE